MSSIRLVVLSAVVAIAAACVTTVTPPPPRSPSPPAPLFHDDLDPYGDWWWHDDHGWVWSPTVGMGWRPYTVGHWVWTDDAGWLWSSHEPFGWAVFHYGRWLWVDDAGWVWLPGRVWGPAWVAWRTGPGTIGWAPLGPQAVWVPGRGFTVVDVEVGLGPWGWVFVEERWFLEPDIVVVVMPRSRNSVVLPETHVRHRPEHEQGRVVNRGVDHEHAARVTGRPIARTTARDAEPRRVPTERGTPRDVDAREDPPRDREARPDQGGAELRPLRTPDDDIDGRYEDERRKTIERHEVERSAPAPSGVRPDELPRRQQRELEEIDREKERDRTTVEKKKKTVRKIPKKKPTRATP